MAPSQREATQSDFKVRLLSALVMVPVFIAALYVGSPVFDALVALSAMILIWEWNRLCGGEPYDAAFVVSVLSILCALFSLSILHDILLGMAALLVGAVVLRLIGRNGAAYPWSVAGLFYVGLSCAAINLVRSDPTFGFIALLWLCVLVWSADTGAYLFGRAIGGPKLAPAVSPAKTWAGFWGGTASSGLAGGIVGYFAEIPQLLLLGILSAGIGVVAQMGDLIESWIKRRFNVKDAGVLIPGHGGLFDRVDGLMAAAVLVGLLQLLSGQSVLAWF